MNKTAIKILSINLLIFTAYTSIAIVYPDAGWLLLCLCIFLHGFICFLLALTDEESMFRSAYIISLLVILLIGIGTCTHLFTESSKHW
jgi:hypothetical protein